MNTEIRSLFLGQKLGAFEAFHGMKRERGALMTFIRCTANKSGGGHDCSTIYTSAGLKMRNGLVQLEVDKLNGVVRLRAAPAGDVGIRVSKNGLFGGSRDIFNVCGSMRIPLSLEKDGWWYGRYQQEAL